MATRQCQAAYLSHVLGLWLECERMAHGGEIPHHDPRGIDWTDEEAAHGD
jgi:hypothetical protein